MMCKRNTRKLGSINFMRKGVSGSCMTLVDLIGGRKGRRAGNQPGRKNGGGIYTPGESGQYVLWVARQEGEKKEAMGEEWTWLSEWN